MKGLSQNSFASRIAIESALSPFLHIRYADRNKYGTLARSSNKTRQLNSVSLAALTDDDTPSANCSFHASRNRRTFLRPYFF
jgi:hypothetical protein